MQVNVTASIAIKVREEVTIKIMEIQRSTDLPK